MPNLVSERPIAELARGEKSRTQSINHSVIQSPSLFDAPGTEAFASEYQGHRVKVKVTGAKTGYKCVTINTRIRDITSTGHPYPTCLPGETGKRRLGIGGHALMSGCPEHWTIQP